MTMNRCYKTLPYVCRTQTLDMRLFETRTKASFRCWPAMEPTLIWKTSKVRHRFTVRVSKETRKLFSSYWNVVELTLR